MSTSTPTPTLAPLSLPQLAQSPHSPPSTSTSAATASATATSFQNQPAQAGPSQPRPTPPSNPSNPSTSPFPQTLTLNGITLPGKGTSTSGSGNANGDANAANGNGNGIGRTDSQQDLQTRLVLAQQAIQGMQQQQQQQQNDGTAIDGERSNSSNAGGQGNGNVPMTMANAAQAAAVLGNIPGANKEQILKQLQALQTSQHHRTRLTQQGITLGSPQPGTPQANGTSPSNISLTPQNPSLPLINTSPAPAPSAEASASSSATPAVSIPHPPAKNATGTGSSVLPLQLTQQQQQDFLAIQQERIRAASQTQQTPPQPPLPTLPLLHTQTPQQSQQPQQSQPQPQPQTQPQQPQPTSANPALQNQAQTPGIPPRPPPARVQQMQDQRKNFVNSLAAYYRANNLPLPTEVFNGEKDGSVKVAGVWLELMDLFMTIMRAQGFQNASKQPIESPLWQSLLISKGIPNPLPETLTLPRPHNSTDTSAPSETTTNPVHYLIGVYRAYLQGFEQHMHKQRQTALERQARINAAAGKPPPPGYTGPAIATPANGVSSPATPNTAAATASFSTPGPPSTTNTSSPAVGNQVAPSSTNVISTPQTSTPQIPATTTPGAPRPGDTKRSSRDGKIRPIPGPISVNGTPDPSIPVSASPLTSVDFTLNSQTSAPPAVPAPAPAKRKRDSKPGSANASAQSSPAKDVIALPLPALAARPSSPKRARYKVEYRPLHLPFPALAGWDERAVASTFPKNNLTHPARMVHELGIVDMEAVLMGIRSRLPKELGYSLTVLSMLSMPHPEERVGGLPLQHLSELYVELLDLLEEAAFGEDGYDLWKSDIEAEESQIDRDQEEVDVGKMTFGELERLGRNFDFSVPAEEESETARTERSGGSTEIVLTVLNLFRNLSMMKENEAIMARQPRLFVILSRITDSRLARLPGSRSDAPYSIYELARVRRDVVVILTNIGGHVNLHLVPPPTVLSIFRLLSTYLSSGFELLTAKESPYGPGLSIREAPPPMVLSVFRAVEAFCKLSAADANREVLGRLPPKELVSLFESMIKLFPLTRRAKEAMFMIEDHLGYVECLAVSVYSLVFFSPLPVRAAMRAVPGAVALLKRVIVETMTRHFDFKDNMFAILCRRVCEILGVLNGTVTCTGEISHGGNMSFSARSGDGKGWRWASGVVEQGWLATDAERLGECLSTRGLDLHTFKELDKMWWVQE